MDIYSKGSYPANALSNFAPHEFVIDGITCASMEGFLQSLKFSNPDMQEHICTLVGIGAKRAGEKKNWKEKQVLYWRGVPYERSSEAYTRLIQRAYDAMYENTAFRKALLASKGMTLTHSIGKRKKNETTLTKTEFIHCLSALRDRACASVS
jgi:predicted NAD-dependent protein-ADP-ribosyltransferase YbiA (DUF1768 family)